MHSLAVHEAITFRFRTLSDVKGIENGCPCIVDIRGTQSYAMVGDPTRAVGEWKAVAKAQPLVLGPRLKPS